jgi:predicted nucleic acid-binding protein
MGSWSAIAPHRWWSQVQLAATRHLAVRATRHCARSRVYPRATPWLDARASTTLVTSALAEVELARALRRTEPNLVAAVPALLDCVGRYEIDELVRTTAAGYASQDLSSLDAIHLATAQAVFGEAPTCFVPYDRRLRSSSQNVVT